MLVEVVADLQSRPPLDLAFLIFPKKNVGKGLLQRKQRVSQRRVFFKFRRRRTAPCRECGRKLLETVARSTYTHFEDILPANLQCTFSAASSAALHAIFLSRFLLLLLFSDFASNPADQKQESKGGTQHNSRFHVVGENESGVMVWDMVPARALSRKQRQA